MSDVVVASGELSAALKSRLASDHSVKAHGRSGRLFFEHGANLYRIVLTPDIEAGFSLRCGVKPLSVDDALWDALNEPVGDVRARVLGPLATCFLDHTTTPVTLPATEAGLATASAQVGQLLDDFGDVETAADFLELAKARYRGSFRSAEFDLGMMLELCARPRTPASRNDFVAAQLARAWASELSEFLGVKVRQRSNLVCFVVGANFYETRLHVGPEIPVFSIQCSVKPYSVDDTLWELIGPYLSSESMPDSLTGRADGAFTVGGLSTHRDAHQMPPVRAGLAQATDIVREVISNFSPAADDQRFIEVAADKYPTTWDLKSTQTLGLLLLYRTGQFARLRATLAERRERNLTGAFSFSDGNGHATSFFDVLSKAIASADLGPGTA